MSSQHDQPAAPTDLTASAIYSVARQSLSQCSILLKVWICFLPLTLLAVVLPSLFYLEWLRDSTRKAYEYSWLQKAQSIATNVNLTSRDLSNPLNEQTDAEIAGFQFAVVTTKSRANPPDEAENTLVDDPLLALLSELSREAVRPANDPEFGTLNTWSPRNLLDTQFDSPIQVRDKWETLGEVKGSDRDQFIIKQPGLNRALVLSRTRLQGGLRNPRMDSQGGSIDFISVTIIKLAALNQKLWQGTLIVVACAVLAAAVLLPTVHFVLNWIVISPIRRLARTMRTATPESLVQLRVPVDRYDEIGELQGAFNLLASVISEKQKQLSGANEELRRSNADLNAFAYTVSHDLQTPLRNVAFIVTEELPEALKLGRTDEALKLAQEAGERCQVNIEMILEILAWSRIGREKITIESIDLNEVLVEVQQTLRQKIAEDHVVLHVDQLPTVYGRRSELQRVLLNLVTNAMKYNQNPEKLITIGCRADPDGRASLYVRDNGIGIREQHLDKVFAPFKRLNSPAKYGGGTGMGLAIVKRIVESYNGRVWVESVFGHGSTFWVTLPPVLSWNGA